MSSFSPYFSLINVFEYKWEHQINHRHALFEGNTMSQDEQGENIQHRFCQFNVKKRVSWECTTEHQSRNAKVHLDIPATKVVPVIFLPSIMGSNLKHKDTGDSVW